MPSVAASLDDFNRDPPNGVSNYISLYAAVARRASIEFCELHGVEHMLQSLVKFVEKVFVKVESGDAKWGIKAISVSVDSKFVLAWIGGASVSYNGEECAIIRRIYSAIARLGEFDIKVLLSWVRAHDNTVHNELADDMAKLGMMNARITLRWEHRFQTHFGRAEWANVSKKSVRRQCMKKAMERTIDAWKVERIKKRRLIMCAPGSSLIGTSPGTVHIIWSDTR